MILKTIGSLLLSSIKEDCINQQCYETKDFEFKGLLEDNKE